MNYWIHRISHCMEISYPLIDKGYLSIGFSDFAHEEFIDAVSKPAQDWGYFEKAFIDEWGIAPKSRYSLWKFIAEMDKGDWVVVPSWGNFSVYEITNAETLLPSSINISEISDWHGNTVIIDKKGLLSIKKSKEIFDIGFLREVKIIAKDIPRNEFADSPFTSRMKIRQTNANINDLEDSVKNALNAFKENKPINLKANLIDVSKRVWLDIILKDLNPTKFEKLVEWYFKRIGATKVEHQPTKTCEGDADVSATFEYIKTIIYVQVKYHKGETSDWAIKQIKDLAKSIEKIDDRYSRIYWVITSSEAYSEESIKIAKENGIQVFTGEEFAQMILEAGISNMTEI